MDEAREKQTFEVFLAHNSQNKPAVRALAALLTERGIRVWFDEEQLIPGRPWQTLMDKGIKESATGAVLVGADGLGPWENEEMQALLQLAVDEKKPVIPVLLPGAPQKPVLPLFLRNRTWVDFRTGFAAEGMDKLIWGIKGEDPGRKPMPLRTSQPVIAVTRLRHGADRLVGREKELARLDTAWQDPKTHVVTIVAWGGVGKTALVVEWMAQMARDGWRGAERVFDWSFYSQGTREQGAASADVFIAKALEFFGDPEMAKSAASPWDKGARLAQLVAQKRTLLDLDGVEPLQYPPGPVGGQLRDPALEALLKGLAQKNPGLCLVTTRESVANLKPYRDTTSPEWLLEHLSEEAGAYLLFEMGVKRAGNAPLRSDDKELKDAVREVGGHALTLQLLGRYLAKVHNGDIRRRDLVRFEKADAKVQGGHAFKVMGMYEQWLAGKGDEDALRQLAVLRLLGLFDRPADAGCLAALREEPAIAGLTEPFIGLSDDDWSYTLANLVECSLISCHENESQIPNRPHQIDCHPLIREYFAKQLREGSPDTWRAGHRRLYEHLCASAREGDEPTLPDLQPLYQAVAHGCQAGLHQEARNEVYRKRIMKGGIRYSERTLGALGANLGVASCFFETQWNTTSPSFPPGDRPEILNNAGFCLRGLGRLDEAAESFEAALHAAIELAKYRDGSTYRYRDASTYANNLSELSLTQGNVAKALKLAEQSVICAREYGKKNWRMTAWAILGDIQHHAGHRDKARSSFDKAKRIQPRRIPHGALRDFLLCDLLLAAPERAAWQATYNGGLRRPSIREAAFKKASDRASGTIAWARRRAWHLIIGLAHLTRGRAAFYRLIVERHEVRSSEPDIEEAVTELRRAGDQRFIPLAFVTRAWLRSLERDAIGAQNDLDEAWEIAERGSMRLHMADIHLYRARLFHGVTPYPWDKDEQGKPQGPKDDLAAARKLIEQCGYWRRKEELEDAEKAAKDW